MPMMDTGSPNMDDGTTAQEAGSGSGGHKRCSTMLRMSTCSWQGCPLATQIRFIFTNDQFKDGLLGRG